MTTGDYSFLQGAWIIRDLRGGRGRWEQQQNRFEENEKNEKGESAVSKWSLVASPLRTGGTDQLVNKQKNGCKDA